MHQEAIKPYHVFHDKSGWYVIDIEGMRACSIDDGTALFLGKLAEDPSVGIEPPISQKLAGLGLLSIESKGTARSKKQTIPAPIVNICLFLTQSCNLKCVYCYGEAGMYGTGGDMDEKTARQAVDWMIEQSGKMKKITVCFFGGEPLLRFPLMKSIVEYTEKKAAKVGKRTGFHLTTNGALVDDETIAFIKEHQIGVQVSFDGPKELQDSQRAFANGEGSYDSTAPKIKKLLQAVPETMGHAVIVGNTDPRAVKDAMKEIGFSSITITPASRSLFTEEAHKEKLARDTANLVNRLEDEAGTWLELIKQRDRESLKNYKGRSQLYSSLMALLHNSRKSYGCSAGLNHVAVSCSGDVYLCHRFVGRDEYKLGTIFDTKLRREEYQQSPIMANEQCASCFAKYYCGGGCKHDHASASGSISKPAEDMCHIRCLELETAASVAARLDDEDKAFLVEYDIFPPKPCPYDL
jgi:uncharacterized protein